MKRWLMVLPLALFLVVAVFLYRGLYLDPAELPSAMIGKPFPAFSLPTLTRSYWGMQVAHLGIAVCALGVVLSSQNSAERDLRLAPGESMDLAGYQFVFEGAKHFEGPNFTSDKGTVRVLRNGQEITVLHPEKRLYTVQNSVMTEAGIDAGFTRDLYVALGESLGDGAWAVRVHVKPFVRWIWFGGLLTGLGGVLAALDRRYRVKVKTRVREALGVTGATA